MTEDFIGRLVKPFTFTDMEISGATTNRIVLDCTVLTKTIGYDIRVGLIFF